MKISRADLARIDAVEAEILAERRRRKLRGRNVKRRPAGKTLGKLFHVKQ